MTFYNEIDPYAAQWIRNLAAAGHISAGTVHERSITDVRSDDLVGVRRAHFFAGIGVWDYALRLAGWPDDRPVWTGSCPCQPFSVAGRGGGFDDDRHLWPEFFRLIRECRPDVVFGEQVSSADGRTWLDAVSADLESAGYAVGAIVANSASVGAPHGRHRIYLAAKLVGHPDIPRREGRTDRAARPRHEGAAVERAGEAGHLAYAGRDERRPTRDRGADEHRPFQLAGRGPMLPWDDLDWIPCRDGKARPTKPGIAVLAPRTFGRVDRLRPGFDGSTSYPAKGPLKGFGNAVTAQVAATFIRAFLESE